MFKYSKNDRETSSYDDSAPSNPKVFVADAGDPGRFWVLSGVPARFPWLLGTYTMTRRAMSRRVILLAYGTLAASQRPT